MKRFDILDHTADIGIVAYGKDLKEAFANTAYGMFSLMTDLRRVRGVLQQETNIQAEEQGSLLVNWLNELLYLFDTEHLLFKRFEVGELSPTKLKATVYGEKIDLARHKLQMGVKAATYYMLKIDRDNGFKVQVIFDV